MRSSKLPENSSEIPPESTDFRFENSSLLLEAVVHSSDDAIITKNLNGIVTSWNPAATRIFGYLPEEIAGQSILRLIPDRLQHEEEEFLRKLSKGEVIAHYETIRLTKDGREINVLLTISPVKDRTGNRWIPEGFGGSSPEDRNYA